MQEQRLDFGSEQEHSVHLGPIQGFLANGVPREDDDLAVRIPYSEGEHAIHVLNARLPVALV